MPATQLDPLKQQIKNAAGNQARISRAQLLRETGIVRLANARLCRRSKSVQKNERKLRQGVYAQQTPDGYRRVSPVQELRTPPGYQACVRRRIIGLAAVGAAVIGALAWLL